MSLLSSFETAEHALASWFETAVRKAQTIRDTLTHALPEVIEVGEKVQQVEPVAEKAVVLASRLFPGVLALIPVMRLVYSIIGMAIKAAKEIEVDGLTTTLSITVDPDTHKALVQLHDQASVELAAGGVDLMALPVVKVADGVVSLRVGAEKP